MAQTISERITKISAEVLQIDALISDLLACPKPTYTVDAQTFKWGEYLKILKEMRSELEAECDALIDIRDGNGFEETQIFVEG